MSRSYPMLVAAALGTLLGCSQSAPTGLAPFTCTETECPAGSCKLVLDFAADCAGQVVDGEVLLNGALEPTAANHGVQFVSVGETPTGATAEFWIRAARWQWGPIQFDCADPKQDGHFTLACAADAAP